MRARLVLAAAVVLALLAHSALADEPQQANSSEAKLQSSLSSPPYESSDGHLYSSGASTQRGYTNRPQSEALGKAEVQAPSLLTAAASLGPSPGQQQQVPAHRPHTSHASAQAKQRWFVDADSERTVQRAMKQKPYTGAQNPSRASYAPGRPESKPRYQPQPLPQQGYLAPGQDPYYGGGGGSRYPSPSEGYGGRGDQYAGGRGDQYQGERDSYYQPQPSPREKVSRSPYGYGDQEPGAGAPQDPYSYGDSSYSGDASSGEGDDWYDREEPEMFVVDDTNGGFKEIMPNKNAGQRIEVVVPPKQQAAAPKTPQPEAKKAAEKKRDVSNGPGCPSAQQADDVKLAYISHGSFIWRERATEAEKRRAAKAQLFDQAGVSWDEDEQVVATGMGRAHHTNYALLGRQDNIDWNTQVLEDSANNEVSSDEGSSSSTDGADSSSSTDGAGSSSTEGITASDITSEIGVDELGPDSPIVAVGDMAGLQADSTQAFVEEQRMLVQQALAAQQEQSAAQAPAPAAAATVMAQPPQQQKQAESKDSADKPVAVASVSAAQKTSSQAAAGAAVSVASVSAAAKPAGATGSSTPASVSASKLPEQKAEKKSGASAGVSIAAVSDVHHLYPTSKNETAYGYYGVRGHYLPSDAAIAVGPHPLDPEGVMVIQGSQGTFEVNMVMLKDGKPVQSVTNNVVLMDDMMAAAGINIDNLYGFNPSAWYDPKEKRYVLMWASGIIENDLESATAAAAAPAPSPAKKGKQPTPAPKTESYPLFIAVSANNNPLGQWTVWALDTVPQIAPGYKFCAGQTSDHYATSTPQGTFTNDAVVVSMGVYCGQFTGSDDQRSFMSVMFVYSKAALYTTPSEDPKTTKPKIYAATYFGMGGWFRSISPQGQALIEDAHKPLNSFIQPARPQELEDMARPPLLTMKVSDTLVSVATLTPTDMSKMTSIKTAPKIVANVVGRGADFKNSERQADGLPVMQQPNTQRVLDAGDVGTVNRTHELRVYWATHVNGSLYLTTSEYWGSGSVRVPSVYWALVQPSADMCTLDMTEWGVVASKEGLATAYPVIAARKDGKAALAFAYSGAGTVSDEQSPANPGVATISLGKGRAAGAGAGANNLGAASPVIQIVKKGAGIINRPELSSIEPQPWGSYSAVQTWREKMWFAVVIPQEVNAGGKSKDKKDKEKSIRHGAWVSAIDL